MATSDNYSGPICISADATQIKWIDPCACFV